MPRYEHSQRGTVLLAVLLAGAAFCLFLPTAASIPPAIPLLTGGILGKEFLLGTDDPERLRAAILRAVS